MQSDADISSSTTVATTTTTVASTSSTATSSAATDTMPPDVGGLPEGCGDGVVEPGQYCYLPVEIPGLVNIRDSISVDFDEDGRDEFVIDAWTEMKAVHVGFDGEAFVELARVAGGTFHEWATEYDFDGDGRRDLVAFYDEIGPGQINWYPNDEGRLGERVLETLIPWVEGEKLMDTDFGIGIPAPIDIDEDGYPEFFEGMYSLEFDVPYGTAQLFRRVGEQYEPDGPPDAGWPLFGCYQPWHNARGDFDEDGDDDLVVLDNGTGCDPYPQEYDPEWHRFLVFLTDTTTASLDLLGTFPTGAAPDGRVWARDVDADGHVDLLIDTSASGSSTSGMTFLPGRGDGTFAAPVVLDTLAGIEGFSLFVLGQLDDDAALEIVIGEPDGLSVLAAPEPEAQRTIIRPIVGAGYPGVRGIGDVNGDGLADILLFETQPAPLGDRVLVLVSAP